jgi:murein DD-endopeptidase MepM/ murein hydrolase activator NlpD
MGRHCAFLLAVVSTLALAGSAAAYAPYGWPVQPFDVQHPIRGNFGDPRTIFHENFDGGAGMTGPGAFSFHNGVDISAPDGTKVYPVVSGVAHFMDANTIVVRTFDGRTFQYFHIVPTVVEGQQVVARLTVLGYVQQSYEHVHLAELDGIRIANPLQPGHLTPYRDTTKPTVAGVYLHDRYGDVAPPATVCGDVSFAADAYDTPTIRPPGRYADMPVAPATVSWVVQSRNGLVVQPERVAVDFSRTLPLPREFWRVYARGSYQNAPRFGYDSFPKRPGRYLYRLGTIDTTLVPNGPYTVTVAASDERRNRGTLTQRFWIANNASGCHVAPSPTSPPPTTTTTTTTSTTTTTTPEQPQQP